ncbi:hypothetical protein [Bacillus amyloliquefaciens]|uniref:hypothetical protein n=1 Tax=Bacillus amyloliquefaciens TaxID=1390 RepID=UPI00228064A4|nr:hypothetical protein [Bacillus amyloliquefaciens]MEC0966118.1 hypothetical protein [Bacillus amyloliquefaciens]MEC1012983.1 hypothetical protein [Bacillus amyloliquefaciens]
MTKIHVLADETLGGIKREYVEVDRKAEVGERIVIVEKADCEEGYKNGDVFTVDREYRLADGDVESDGASSDTNYSGLIYREEYRVLEPTDIVHIGGQRYELTDRKAEVGEKIIVVDDEDSSEEFGSFRIGEVGTVESYSSDDMYFGIYANVRVSDERDIPLYSHEYRVLVPVEAAEDEPKPADPIDVIASLAQEVAEMKRKVSDQQRMLDVLQRRQVLDNIQSLKREQARHRDEIDTLHKDSRTLGEELARLKEPVDSESTIESAPFVLVIYEGRGEFDVYQRGKKIEHVSRVEIEAYSRLSSSIDLQFDGVGERL